MNKKKIGAIICTISAIGFVGVGSFFLTSCALNSDKKETTQVVGRIEENTTNNENKKEDIEEKENKEEVSEVNIMSIEEENLIEDIEEVKVEENSVSTDDTFKKVETENKTVVIEKDNTIYSKEKEGIVNSGKNLNVRSSATIDSNNIILSIENGRKITIIGETDSFYKVRITNNIIGYVSKLYITDVEEVKPPIEVTPEAPTNQNTESSKEEIKNPSVEEEKPSEPITSPEEETPPAKEEEESPVEEVIPPIEEVTPPIEEEIPPTEEEGEKEEVPPTTEEEETTTEDTSEGNQEVPSESIVNVKDINMTIRQYASKISYAFDNRNYRQASVDDIIGAANPINLMENSRTKYQLMEINKFHDVDVNILNDYLKGCGVLEGKGQAFIDSAKKYDIDPIYLVAHSIWESGRGSSTLAKGVTVTQFNGETLESPVVVHNLFGIGAIDDDALGAGAATAYKYDWTSIEKAIDGGASWIARNYIKDEDFNQNTLWKMRWNTNIVWHAYATDIWWANGISSLMTEMEDCFINPGELVFEQPKFIESDDDSILEVLNEVETRSGLFAFIEKLFG